MTIWICATCGVEHPDTDAPQAADCLICEDERQWVPESGQSWTTQAELAAQDHRLVHEELERGLHRINREPGLGIGQRTYLVQTPQGNLMWDPPNHLDLPTVEKVAALGGIAVIVASHPHMFGSQVSWSEQFDDAPILVHSADRSWVQRESPVIREWSGTEEILPGVTLVTAGGHFPGSAVAHVAHGAEGRGTLLVGDTIMPVLDSGWVTFERSYPNRIPLSPMLVRRIVDRLEPYPFERLYALTGGRVAADAKNAVHRSAQRYIDWVTGKYDDLG
ncbi:MULTISPECIES: hydrolase [Actinoalloteichus]|uniref:hydrolase n=1 Tax=Actinoalloteichus TaxID=65496 RepID=UPI000950F189|nr:MULTISPECIES: hydrolase [Actinoalloteichus]